jgi:hypothetical protein
MSLIIRTITPDHSITSIQSLICFLKPIYEYFDIRQNPTTINVTLREIQSFDRFVRPCHSPNLLLQSEILHEA